jgi:GMP synthase (glutamine-hydrolysing)
LAPRVLTVVHKENATTGRIGEVLTCRGYALERCCPSRGDTLPVALDEFAGLIVFGGSQSALDDAEPGITDELEWLESCALPSARPLLGICLGAQLLARSLGGKVYRHPENRVEIGYTEVSPMPDKTDFLAAPTLFYQWHEWTFEIPMGAEHLARSEAFDAQAFRYDSNVYGLEFHPEITATMIQRWSGSENGRARIAEHGGPDYERQLADYARYAASSDAWLEGFLRDFLAEEE